jgi:hypothetical protein
MTTRKQAAADTVADLERKVGELAVTRAGLVEIVRVLTEQKDTAQVDRDTVYAELAQAIIDRDNARAELAAADAQLDELRS